MSTRTWSVVGLLILLAGGHVATQGFAAGDARAPTETKRDFVLYAVIGGVVALQSVLIGALMLQGARRRRVEAALRESEAHFRTMADTAPVLIWRSTGDARCDFVNRPWLEFRGRTMAEELGDGWAEGVHPDDRESCLRTYTTAFEARQPFRMEYRLRRFDGEYRWMLDSGVPRNDNGAFTGYIGSALDITDRKEAELAVSEAHVELRRMSRLSAMGEFAASVAHEVRQPLTAIIMNARSCLRDMEADPPRWEDVRAGLLDVVEATQRAEQVIQHNRELFSHHTVQALPLDINGVVREAIALSAARLRESQVTVVTNLADDVPAASGDRIELQQVLLNLFTNAAEAMEDIAPSARRIEVTTTPSGDEAVAVTVRDTGVGLGDVDLRRIFTLSYTTKATGTGVGLSISRSIVEAHGGRLWAEPAVGPGATFTFTVPRRTPPDGAVAPPAAAARAEPPAGGASSEPPRGRGHSTTTR